jgi:hypothetical protein
MADAPGGMELPRPIVPAKDLELSRRFTSHWVSKKLSITMSRFSGSRGPVRLMSKGDSL